MVSSGVQRTSINTECKYMLLQYAFEKLHMLRVQIKTDARNEKAQRAIERLGAVKRVCFEMKENYRMVM